MEEEDIFWINVTEHMSYIRPFGIVLTKYTVKMNTCWDQLTFGIFYLA